MDEGLCNGVMGSQEFRANKWRKGEVSHYNKRQRRRIVSCAQRENGTCTPVVLMSSIIILSWVKNIISLTASWCWKRNRIKVELLASRSFSAPLGIIILCNVLINMLTGFPLSKVGWAILEKNSWLSIPTLRNSNTLGLWPDPSHYCLLYSLTSDLGTIKYFFSSQDCSPHL